jgi:hypothetical protein
MCIILWLASVDEPHFLLLSYYFYFNYLVYAAKNNLQPIISYLLFLIVDRNFDINVSLIAYKYSLGKDATKFVPHFVLFCCCCKSDNYAMLHSVYSATVEIL